MQNKNDLMSVIENINNNKKTRISGLSSGVELYLMSKLSSFFVYITSKDNLEKARLELQILGKNPMVFPFIALDNKYSFSISSEIYTQQINALFDISRNRCDSVVLQIEALLQLLPNKSSYDSFILNLQVNHIYNINEIIKKLELMQYKMVDKVELNGQISLRGDILDIFPMDNKNFYRLSFFDDELESIKELEINENGNKVLKDNICIPPNTLFTLNENEIQECKQKLELAKKNSTLEINENTRFHTLCGYCIENLENNPTTSSNLWMQSIAFNSTIFDWLSNDTIIISKSNNELFSQLENAFEDIYQKKEKLAMLGECLPFSNDFQSLKYAIQTNLDKFTAVNFENIVFDSSNSIINYDCEPVFNYKNKKESLIYDTKELLEKGFRVVIFCPSELDETFLTEMFQKQFIHYEKLLDLEKAEDGKLYFFKSNLPYGIILNSEKLAYLPCGEKNLQNISYGVAKQTFFDLPKSGDYVVHDFHGIGLCQGIQTMEVANFKRDYIVIQYQNSDKLYLPIENADQLTKYVGQENPKLNKIGGAEFERAKKRVREQMEFLAYDMLKIYYEREHTTGHQYEVNTFIDKEFADAFPYQETPDQLKAIEDINNDMKSTKIMDRLICGDVGYGKTEVAFRTAMTAINNGKQVVMLVPTTILSEQHFRSAKSRFSGFGVKIEVLNRFKSASKVQEIYSRLANGDIDLLIGTQKVLNSSIKYKNLGLLILDEEQRLGVNDKEKIKKLKTNLDVLSMSATPIPRTLNMALTGVRDISTIATPPKLRKSIETTILEYSDSLVFNAIAQEVERGGQVLVVTNKIMGIENIAGNIQNHFPNIKVAFAHAQMTKLQLENISLRLFSGEIDVLVSTTLIENGIDLPNANTLIVLNADRFGLSQLYQLRGRVGRSDRQAYAYFCFENYKTLSVDSLKRLEAIQDFTALGSGFKIAMRDLELRGAGNILGEKQSGHLEKVGYDMYCRLLEQALEVARGNQNINENIETKIDVALATDVPQWYVASEIARFDLINSISKLQTQEELESLSNKTSDEFGKLPQSIINLMQVALTKNLAQFFGIKHLKIVQNQLQMNLNKNSKYFDKLKEFIEKDKYFDLMNKDNEYYVRNHENNANVFEMLQKIQELLQKCRISVLN